MKKLEIIIKSERLEEVKNVLTSCGISGMMVNNIMGFGNQKGYTGVYRGSKYTVNLLPKLKIEIVVPAEKVDEIVDKIVTQTTTGQYGDGKIFIYDVVDVIRIRTGEKGKDAL